MTQNSRYNELHPAGVAGQAGVSQEGYRMRGPQSVGSAGLGGWLAVAIPVLAELVVGGYRIAGPSLWRDEAATISGAQRPFGSILSLTLHQDAVHGPYYLLMHAVIAVGGTSETALRLPSLIAMGLAAGLTAVLARRLACVAGLAAPDVVGLLAGLALVAVPLSTRYAQEARPYALTTLFAVAATYAVVRAAQSEGWPWWICYAAALTLTGLLNLFAILLVVAHGLSLLAAGDRRPLRRWIAACAVAAVLLAPLAVLSARQSAQLNWVTRPGLSTIASLVRDFSGATVAIPVIGLLGLLGCVAGAGLRRGRGLTLAVVALPWLVVPPVVLIAVSLADPVYVERYVVFCLPALALLVAAGLAGLVRLVTSLARKRGLADRPARVLGLVPAVLLGALVIGALAGPQRSIRLPSARADNLRAVAGVVAANERAGDAILYLPWDTELASVAYPAPFARLRDIGLGEAPVASDTLRGLPARASVVVSRLREVSRVWTIQWTPALPSPGSVQASILGAQGLRLLHRWHIQSVVLSIYARRT